MERPRRYNQTASNHQPSHPLSSKPPQLASDITRMTAQTTSLPTLAPAPARDTPQNQPEHGGGDEKPINRHARDVSPIPEGKDFPLKFCTVCASNQNRYVSPEALSYPILFCHQNSMSAVMLSKIRVIIMSPALCRPCVWGRERLGNMFFAFPFHSRKNQRKRRGTLYTRPVSIPCTRMDKNRRIPIF